MQPTDPRPEHLISGAYDPAVTSDGLTIDTPAGPVDLVAIDRARHGLPVALTPADRAHARHTRRTLATVTA